MNTGIYIVDGLCDKLTKLKNMKKIILTFLAVILVFTASYYVGNLVLDSSGGSIGERVVSGVLGFGILAIFRFVVLIYKLIDVLY